MIITKLRQRKDLFIALKLLTKIRSTVVLEELPHLSSIDSVTCWWNIFTLSDNAKHLPKTRSHSIPKNLTLRSRLHELIISFRQSSSSKVCLEFGPVMSNKIRHCLLGITSLQIESTVSFASCSSAPSCTIRRMKTYSLKKTINTWECDIKHNIDTSK